MSETRLVIVDAEKNYEGTIHTSMVDRCVAALSAEPETFAELQAALTRYIKLTDDRGPLEGLRPSPEVRTEPRDAGVVIMDLAAQVIAWESTYFQPESEGSVNYHDGRAATDISIRYRIPDSWEFVASIESYSGYAASGRARRAACPPLDARPVLYGRPLLEFIIEQVTALPLPESANQELRDDLIDTLAREIHGRWLTASRTDLQGQAPRDVLLARHEFVDFDLDSRELQWSLLLEAPPCLARESHAYRFAGFGTHENVMYYDLVRHVICSAFDSHRSRGAATVDEQMEADFPAAPEDLESQVVRLQQIKQTWLQTPGSDSGGRAPVNIIESERRRLPLALRPSDLIIDDDCPLCVMTAQEAAAGVSIGFQHFDGSHMDDDFVFSFFRTREEWEEENRRRQEFHRDFDRRWKEREARIAAGENPDIVDTELGFDYARGLGDAESDVSDAELIG
jgi:hypothetical protein